MGVFEPAALNQLEAEGKKIPLNSTWQAVPADMIVVFCRRPWENCSAISFDLAYSEKAFDGLKEHERIDSIYLIPRHQPPFFQKWGERQAIVHKPPQKKSAPIFRDLTLVF